jgi:hypothetical protein
LHGSASSSSTGRRSVAPVVSMGSRANSGEGRTSGH